MPTIVLLDVSLSMSRIADVSTDKTILDNVCEELRNFFGELLENCKLEYTALMVFSSMHEVLVKFTRNYEALQNVCSNIETYNKTCFQEAFKGVAELATQEWGSSVPIHLIIVTDGSVGIGEGSLKDSLSRKSSQKTFSFPCHLTLLCVSNEITNGNRALLEQLVTLNQSHGELLVTKGLAREHICRSFKQIFNKHYSRTEALLKCGNFESSISVFPKANFENTISCLQNNSSDIETINYSSLKLPATLNIVGFLDLQDFSNPPFISRHMILPYLPQDGEVSRDKAMLQPNFCVLLHGSLKTENMGALVSLGEDWYGMLYSWGDNKKRFVLMLSVFKPNQPFSWLGDLKKLGPAMELPSNPYRIDLKDNSEETPFPVAPKSRRSYHTQSTAVWIKQSGLQSDIQKLLRYAKKLPEKQSAFFKEVNKLRRAGVIYGFHEMLHGLADTLEKEATHTSKESSVQLCHAAEGLRNAAARDLNKNIVAINAFRRKSVDV